MNLAQSKIAALKKRLERISQLDANLEFTERELEQRRRQFSQDYLVLPPISPNPKYLRTETQSQERDKPSQSKRNNTYNLNTDFYKRTVFPDTNTNPINELQNKKPNWNFEQKAEPMSIQEPQKKHNKQLILKSNMINEDKFQSTNNSFLKLVQVQQAKPSQQNIKVVVKPRQNTLFSNNSANNLNTVSGLFTFPVSSETKNLFQTKKPQISLTESSKELKSSKSEELPQNANLITTKPLQIQKSIITEKPIEPVSSIQVPPIESKQTNTLQTNILQKTKTAPLFTLSQQRTLTGTLFNQNNLKDNKTNSQIIPSSLFGNVNKQSTSTTNLFGGNFQTNIPQRSLFALHKPTPLFDKSQSMIKSAPFVSTLGQNKKQSLFEKNQEATKMIVQQKKNEINDQSTPAQQIDNQPIIEEPKKQAKLFIQNYQSYNPSQSKFLKPEPKKRSKQSQQKKEEPKYPQIDSPIMQLKNPQEIQVPQPKEQIKKDLEVKQTNKGQMLGPKGKTIQILPFFGTSAKAMPPLGQTNLLNSENKPSTANQNSANTSSTLFQSVITSSQNNPAPSSLFGGNSNTPNIFTSNTNAPNLFSGTNTNVPSLFGNPLAKASSSEFSQAFLNKAGGGLFSGQVNSLFSQSSGNSLFSGQNNSLFSGQNTGSLFGGQTQNKEDDEQSAEGDDQPLQAEENFNPELSTGKYDYIQTKVFFKEAINKFRKGKGQVLENISVSLQQFQDSSNVFLLVRLANKVIGFSGRIVPKASQIRVLNNSARNLQVSKILECGDTVSKPELCLLRLQFKDEQSGSKFKEQFQKILKASS